VQFVPTFKGAAKGTLVSRIRVALLPRIVWLLVRIGPVIVAVAPGAIVTGWLIVWALVTSRLPSVNKSPSLEKFGSSVPLKVYSAPGMPATPEENVIVFSCAVLTILDGSAKTIVPSTLRIGASTVSFEFWWTKEIFDSRFENLNTALKFSANKSSAKKAIIFFMARPRVFLIILAYFLYAIKTKGSYASLEKR
jgi:hypothetical protein